MKGTEKMLVKLTALTMALQGFVFPISANAKTVVDSGNGYSIDFEEYTVGETPTIGSANGGWVFTGVPSGKSNIEFFKIQKVTGYDGTETNVLEFSKAKDTEVTYEVMRLQYYADKAIKGDYIEASYDILVDNPKYVDGTGYQEVLRSGFTLTDKEDNRLTEWSVPKAIDKLAYFDGSYFYGFHKFLTETNKDDTDHNPRFNNMFRVNHDASKDWTDSEWVRIKKVYDMKKSEYTLYLNGQKKGTYTMGVASKDICGVNDFFFDMKKGELNRRDVKIYIDNITVKQHNPDLVKFDFEDDKIGELPSGVDAASNAIDVKDQSLFYNVQSVKGKDGKQSKVLHFNSQPTEGTTYEFKDYARAKFSYDPIVSKYVKVSYDVMLLDGRNKSSDRGNYGFEAGFYTAYEKENGTFVAENEWGYHKNGESIWTWDGSFSLQSTNAANIGNVSEQKWVTVTRIYDTENKTASLYVDDKLVQKDVGVKADYDFTAIKDFICKTSKGELNYKYKSEDETTYANKIEYYIDNITAEPVSYKYAPASYTINFENDTVGELPAGSNWEFRTSKGASSSDLADKYFFNVQEIADKDGDMTKALHYTSQPTKEKVYTDFGDYSRAQYNFGNVMSRFIRVSYDVKVESDPTGGYSSGFVNVNENGNSEMVWGLLINKDWTYYDTENGQKVCNWKFVKDGGNNGVSGVFDKNGKSKWITIERLYDTSANTYTMYIDGVEKFTNVKVPSTYTQDKMYTSDIGGVSAFQAIISKGALNTGNNYEYYIDNIKVEEIYSETPSEYYVSATGSDSNDGESDRYPFATIAKAKEAARKASMYSEDVKIHILPGEYTENVTFTSGDSPAMENGKITFIAEEGVTFTGETHISADKFTKASNVKAEADVYVADLNEYGLNFPELKDYMHGQKGISLPYGVIQNGQNLTVARYPNYTYTETTKDDVSITEETVEDKTKYVAAITIDTEKAQKWANADDMFVKGYLWDNWGFLGKNAKVEDGKITFDNKDDYKLSYGRYAVTNLLEELDIPGEYYIDRTNKKLYVCPLDGKLENISLTTNTDTMIKVDGAKNLVFDGIDVKNTNGCAYEITSKSDNITVQNAEISGVYAPYAIVAKANNTTFDKLSMHDLPAGAIAIESGDVLHWTDGNSKVTNSEIYDYAQDRETYYSAIDLRGCGNIASNNIIHDAPHFGIQFVGAKHTIEYNEIYNVCTNSLDSSAIYSNSQWYETGSVIKYNKIHDLFRIDVNGDTNRVSAIFIDDATGGITIEGNIIENCPNGMHISGGKGMTLKNNIINDCTQGITFTVASDTAGKNKKANYESYVGKNEEILTTTVQKERFGDCYKDYTGEEEVPVDGEDEKNMLPTYRLPTKAVVKNNIIVGTKAENFEKTADPGISPAVKAWVAITGDYQDNSVKEASEYTNESIYNAISAEIAKAGKDVARTTVTGGVISLVSVKQIDDSIVEFIWNNNTGIGRYSFVMADNEALEQPIISKTTNEKGITAEGLTRGVTYYYSITASDFDTNNSKITFSGSVEIPALVIGKVTADKSVASNQKVTFTLNADKADSVNGVVVAAVMNGDKLVALNSGALQNGTTSVEVNVPENSGDNLTATIYVWKSLDSMTPLCNKITNYTVSAQ